MVEVNALVQTQTKKQRLFEGLVASNDVELGSGGVGSRCGQTGWGWGGGGQGFVEIAGGGKTHRASVGRPHRVSNKNKAPVGVALPVLYGVGRTGCLPA